MGEAVRLGRGGSCGGAQLQSVVATALCALLGARASKFSPTTGLHPSPYHWVCSRMWAVVCEISC